MDSFSNVSRDEDNILEQIYIEQMCSEGIFKEIQLALYKKELI